MITKCKRIINVNQIHFVVGVLFAQLFEDTYFFLSLTVKILFISYDFNGAEFSLLVVETFEHLAERAFAKYFYGLVSVLNVVVLDEFVVAFFVVVAVVVGRV